MMMSTLMNRRAVLVKTLIAAGAGVALTGCATSASNDKNVPIIRSIEVTGHQNLWIEMISPYVQSNLAQQLGTRFQPGAKGGANLLVELVGIELPMDTASGVGMFGSDSSDVLQARITLVSPAGGQSKAFPLLVSTYSIDASDMITSPTKRRLNSLAYTFAYWVIGKLG